MSSEPVDIEVAAAGMAMASQAAEVAEAAGCSPSSSTSCLQEQGSGSVGCFKPFSFARGKNVLKNERERGDLKKTKKILDGSFSKPQSRVSTEQATFGNGEKKDEVIEPSPFLDFDVG